MRHSLFNSQKIRFGTFEFDVRSGELRKGGEKIKLQGQPIKILSILLKRQGDLVTREELQKELWSDDTFVDYEHSINAAIKRLRQALNDSSEKPQFIETLARRGYRFIASVEIHSGVTPELHNFTLQQRIRLLAVLPFEKIDTEPAIDYLSEAITEGIINRLSHLQESRVVARSIVLRHHNPASDPQMIGRKLNVEAVLLGWIRQCNNSLYITTELIDVTTGWQLWGEQYNRVLSEALTLHIEIAGDIFEQLRLHLCGEVVHNPAMSDSENSDAGASTTAK